MRTDFEKSRERKRLAFTLLEVMLAIAIFSMVMAAIYASWSAILQGTRSGLDAAAEVQRTRVTLRSLEDSLGAAVMYADNWRHYWILADTSGEFAGISFVARLPESFVGGNLFDQPVRRVSFMVEDGTLKLAQSPLLEATEEVNKPYVINLAPNIGQFTMEFLDMRRREWVTEWVSTNQLPYQVKFTIGFADKKNPGKITSSTTRIVPINAFPISRIGGAAPVTGQPGEIPQPQQ